MPIVGIVDSEVITVSSSVKQLSRQTDVVAHVEVQAQAIRYRVGRGGGLISATVGKIGAVGDVIELIDESEVSTFRAIRKDGTDATLEVLYAREYVP